MSLNVLLVDDEPLALERLRVAFADIDDVAVVGSAQDGQEAAEMIAALKPNLVILDVQMPGQTGMAVARALDGDARPEVIFVTAFDHYATEAFDVEATDYLLKPVKFDRLRVAVERARRRWSQRAAGDRAAELESEVVALRAEAEPLETSAFDQELWIPTRKGMVRLPVERIDWIEAARDYVLLHTSTRSHILRISMTALEKRLDPAAMLRVHRSAFVRKASIAAVQKPGKGLLALTLADETVVQVGPNYVHAIAEALGI